MSDTVQVDVELLERAIIAAKTSDMHTLAAELAALLPKPDEARELLARAMEAGGEPSMAGYIRKANTGRWLPAITIIRDALDNAHTQED